MNNNLWYNKTFSKPIIVDSNYYHVVVSHDEPYNSNRKEEIFLSGRETGLRFLLAYYNLKDNDDFQWFLQNKTTVKEWYVGPNFLSKIKLLIQIDKEKFHEMFFEEKEIDLSHDSAYEIDKNRVSELFNFLIEEVKRVDREYTEFVEDLDAADGPKLDFTLEINKTKISTVFDADLLIQDIKTFKKSLSDLIQENKGSKYDKIIIHVKNENVVYVKLDDIVLNIGASVYLQKLNRNPKLVRLVQGVKTNLDGEFYIEDAANWKDFLYNYLDLPLTFALFQDETIQKTYKNVKAAYQAYKDLPRSINVFDIPGKFSPALSGLGDKLDSRLKLDAKLKKIKDRESIYDPIIDNVVHEIQITYPTLETLDEIYDYIVNKISVDELIEILLKCLRGFGFDFNFRFSFDFRLPKLPRIDIYDLYLFLELNIEEIFLLLMKYLIDQIFGYLLDLLREFCENLWKPERGIAPDLQLGDDVSFPDYGDLNELLKEFLKDLFGQLTANQICGLLNGEPTAEVLEIIYTLLKQPKYFLLRDKFKTESDILLFFKSFAKTIDKSQYCDIIEETTTVDPCTTKEAFEQFMKQLYGVNHNLTDEETQEILDGMQKRLSDFNQSIEGFNSEFASTVSDKITQSTEQEIELVEDNPYNSVYKQTIKTMVNAYAKTNFSSELQDFNIYYIEQEDTLFPRTILNNFVDSLPAAGKNDPVLWNIINELSKETPGTNDKFKFKNFIQKINLNYKEEFEQKYLVNKKRISEMQDYDCGAVCKQIIFEYSNRVNFAQKLILFQPLPLQISYDYKFDKDFYETLFPNVNATKLETLVREGEKLEDYISIFEKISIYFSNINSSKEELLFLDKNIKRIEESFG